MPELPMDRLREIVRGAGRVLLNHYRRPLGVRGKADGSPVTEADLASSRYLREALAAASGLPVVCEEAQVPWETRRGFTRYWLVDPLDGTKDYLARNDEFTVNVALVEGDRPVAGVVFAPALGELFFAERGKGAFAERAGGAPVRLPRERPDGLVAARSRFHDTPLLDKFLKRNGIERSVRLGSALKFCRLAEGKVNVYARLVGSSEWDTAAGHLLVEEAGGRLVVMPGGGPLLYNKPEMENPFFLATGADVKTELILYDATERCRPPGK